MRSHICKRLVVFATFCVAAGCAHAEDEKAKGRVHTTAVGPVRVELSSSAIDHLLGQPIRLTLRVTNQGDKPIEFHTVHIGDGEQVMLYVSTDGTGFVRREEGTGDIVNYGNVADTLAPGASREYHVRILYSAWSADKLTFPQPGRYWIRLDFPLRLRAPGKSQMLPSNAVEVRIAEPKGVDATMFQTLRQEPFLLFLYGDGGRPDAIKTVLELLKKHPKSGYHADLKASLEAYYRRVSRYPTSQTRSDPELKAVIEDVRAWLGVPGPEDGPFPDDKRLAVKFTTSFEGGVTFEEILRRVSKLTNVRLSVAPELAQLKMDAGLKERQLRTFMENLSSEQKRSIRDGDGYKLVPKPKEKAKPAGGSR